MLTYINSLRNGFVNWDDNIYVLSNKDVTNFTLLGGIHLFKSIDMGNYFPFTILSFALEYKCFGSNPYYYHLDNLILHILNLILVFIFIRELSTILERNQNTENREQSTNIALLVAFLFGIHPMHVESVAWIAERKDVLFAFFYLWSLIFYINFLKKNIQTCYNNQNSNFQFSFRLSVSRLFYLLSLLMFIFSIFSKVSSITLPLVLLCLDYFLIPQARIQNIKNFFSNRNLQFAVRSLLIKFPFLLLTIAFIYVNYVAQSKSGALVQIKPFNILDRFFLINYSLVIYIYKMFLPFTLCLAHPFPIKNEATLPIIFYISPIIFLFSLFLLYKIIHTSPIVIRSSIVFGFIFFLASILLTINIIPFGTEIISERYTYVPYIGLFYSLAYILIYLKSKIANCKFIFLNHIAFFLLFIYFSSFCITTFVRCKVWKNTMTLFTDLIQKEPNVAYANLKVAEVLNDKKEYKQALKYLNTAIANRQNFTSAYILRGVVKNYLGYFYDAIGDFDIALKYSKNSSAIYANRSNSKGGIRDFKGQLSTKIKLFLYSPMLQNST